MLRRWGVMLRFFIGFSRIMGRCVAERFVCSSGRRVEHHSMRLNCVIVNIFRQELSVSFSIGISRLTEL